MSRPRRRLIVGVLVLFGIIFAATAVRMGIKWKRALDDVDAMYVPPVSLPTAITPTATIAPTSLAQSKAPTSTALPTQIPTPEPTQDPVAAQSLNLLLLGTDARVGEDISRTDAMILVHLNPQTAHVSMLSLPRDLWVPIPGHSNNKINAAYPTGEKQIGKGYGAALAKETVGNLTGLKVDRFVLINFEGFKALIDKLGGITIDVPKAITDNAYPVDEYPGDVRTKKIHFDAGEQTMDGTTALIYARTRHADSDFGRNDRQQQVLMAIFNRIRADGLMNNLNNVDEYTGALRDYIRTDLSRSEMLSLARIGPNLSQDSIQRFAISPKMVSETTNPYRLVLADTKSFKHMLAEMVGSTVASAGGQQP